MFSSWCGKKCMQVHTDPAFSPQSPLRVVPGFKTSFPIRIHWGIGQFCFCFLTRNYLILKVLWEEQYQPYIPQWQGKGGSQWHFQKAVSQVYYQGWNRSPAQVGCMRQVLSAGALGRPRRMGWGGRWEEGLGWGTHVNPWLIHVNVWQKPLQYCKVISLQLIKINENK